MNMTLTLSKPAASGSSGVAKRDLMDQVIVWLRFNTAEGVASEQTKGKGGKKRSIPQAQEDVVILKSWNLKRDDITKPDKPALFV